MRRNRRAPVEFLLRLLQPLGVLVEHRIDDVDEGFVGGEEAVAPGQHIAFEPAFEGMLAQHFHDAAVGRELAAVGILGLDIRRASLFRCFVDAVQLVRCRFVGTEDAEVVMLRRMTSRRNLAERRPWARCIACPADFTATA